MRRCDTCYAVDCVGYRPTSPPWLHRRVWRFYHLRSWWVVWGIEKTIQSTACFIYRSIMRCIRYLRTWPVHLRGSYSHDAPMWCSLNALRAMVCA